MKTEQQKLSEISKWYSNRNWGFYTKIVHFTFETIKPFIMANSVLEVGPADGEMTRFLLKVTDDLTIVDAAKEYVTKLKKLSSKITGHASMAENFVTKKRFETIILSHVLEHAVDPIKLLNHLGNLLSPDGVLIIVVPNAKSIHRQLGVKMGLMHSLYELNIADKSVDHKRVYDFNTLIKDVESAGLSLNNKGGILFKPLSNNQIEEFMDDNIIKGLFELGKDYPELCSEIFVVCKKQTHD